MSERQEFAVRAALLLPVWAAWWWAAVVQLAPAAEVAIIAGGLLLTYPLVWLGRISLPRGASLRRVNWMTTGVHLGLGFTLGVPLVRAVATHAAWPGPGLAFPAGIGLALTLLSGTAFFVCVANLALKGLGAPFYLALSEKLAVEWLYAWTRNPMALAGIAFLFSLGLWYQSALFAAWALLLFSPALLFFIRVYEQWELELRFGEPYLEYKRRTPFLIPRRPPSPG